jgi:DNA-binding response OmpR family regulator
VARILVAEDEELVRRMMQAALKQRGHQVEACSDGQAALRKLQEQPFDVLITDYRMPKMTGVELIKATAGLGVPTILMSSNTIEEMAINAKDLAGVEYLRKPFGLTDLHAAIARSVRKE